MLIDIFHEYLKSKKSMFRDQLTVWPGHPKPKEGELLSSWITRLARANHMATADFCRVVLPDKSATLKEIDRTYNAELMQALADGTGVPIEHVWETSLLSEEGYVFNRRPYGTTEWILPTAAIDGVDGNGMVYCPQCLSSDDEPYYRKSWRFAIKLPPAKPGVWWGDALGLFRPNQQRGS